MKKIIACLLGTLMLYSVNQIGMAFSSPIPDMNETFENQTLEQVSVSEEQKVEDKSESTDETEVSSTQSSVSTETEKKIESEVSSSTTPSNSNSSESKNEITESKQVVQSKPVEQPVSTPEPKKEEVKQPAPQNNYWDSLGISEYDYYNKPAHSWARLDFKSSDYGNYEATLNACKNYGNEYISKNGGGYFCDSVNSYSGNYLGEMIEFY